jgi:hypothetical protein
MNVAADIAARVRSAFSENPPAQAGAQEPASLADRDVAVVAPQEDVKANSRSGYNDSMPVDPMLQSVDAPNPDDITTWGMEDSGIGAVVCVEHHPRSSESNNQVQIPSLYDSQDQS